MFLKKLLELISEVSKVAGYEIDTRKSVALIYTDNEQMETKVKKKNAIKVKIVPKKMKYLSKNLTKHVQDLCDESYKMLLYFNYISIK